MGIAPGFDTISYRLSSSYPDVQFWEVDHPATGKVRQRGLNALGSKPSNMHLLLADLTKHNLADFLSGQDGFDVSAPTVVIIEGLLPYLEKEHAKDLFIEVSKSVGLGSVVLFSFLKWDDDKNSPDTFGAGSKSATTRMKRWGEPHLFGIDPSKLSDFLKGTPWEQVGQVSSLGTQHIARAEMWKS